MGVETCIWIRKSPYARRASRDLEEGIECVGVCVGRCGYFPRCNYIYDKPRCERESGFPAIVAICHLVTTASFKQTASCDKFLPMAMACSGGCACVQRPQFAIAFLRLVLYADSVVTFLTACGIIGSASPPRTLDGLQRDVNMVATTPQSASERFVFCLQIFSWNVGCVSSVLVVATYWGLVSASLHHQIFSNFRVEIGFVRCVSSDTLLQSGNCWVLSDRL